MTSTFPTIASHGVGVVGGSSGAMTTTTSSGFSTNTSSTPSTPSSPPSAFKAFGSPTTVPDNDVCFLAYYLKCCNFGCGIETIQSIEVMDYKNAHLRSDLIQTAIYMYALSDFNPKLLLNRILFIDDNNILLPPGTGNGFFERSLVVAHGLLQGNSVANVNKFMFCTTQWLEVFCIGPLYRYIQSQLLTMHQQQQPQPPHQQLHEDPFLSATAGTTVTTPCVAIATRVDVSSPSSSSSQSCCHCSTTTSSPSCACRTYRQVQQQQRDKENCSNTSSHKNMVCDGCYMVGINQRNENSDHEGPTCYYQCITCPKKKVNLCEDCYTNSELHDQTHAFLRFATVSSCDTANSDPQYMSPRISVMTDQGKDQVMDEHPTTTTDIPSSSNTNNVQDIPIATAIPIVDVSSPIDEPPRHGDDDEMLIDEEGMPLSSTAMLSTSTATTTRCFHQGQLVRITGLTTARHMNGCVAIVESMMMCDDYNNDDHQHNFDYHRRIIVRLVAEGKPLLDREFSFHPDNLKLVRGN